MKLLYADAWMIEALKAANKTPAALLDLPVLLNTLSQEDVAFYLDMNKNLAAFLPIELVSSFTAPPFTLKQWVSGKQAREVEDLLEARRLTKAKVIPEDAKNAQKMLTVDILDDETLLVHYIDRSGDVPFDARSKAAWISSFAERALRQMAALIPFESIAPLPLLRWYLQARSVILRPNTVV